jgi:hypothetical protein
VNRDICEIKIRAFSQQRLTGKLGERIGETVSEVQSCRVSTLSVPTPGRADKVGLVGVYRYDLEIGTNHEEIELAARGLAQSAFENDSSFENTSGGYQAASGCSDGIEEFLTLRFREKDGCKGGGINHHMGWSAGKSVVVVAQDLVRSAGIQDGQLVNATQDLLQLAGEDLTSALMLEPFQAFFQGLLNRRRQRLSGLSGDLAGQAFGL